MLATVILVGVRTNLPYVMVRLNQAAIVLHDKGEKQEDKSVPDPVAAVQYRWSSRDDQMDRHKWAKAVDDN